MPVDYQWGGFHSDGLEGLNINPRAMAESGSPDPLDTHYPAIGGSWLLASGLFCGFEEDGTTQRAIV